MKDLHYSRNCEEISIHHFQKILKDSDYRYIIRNWDEYEEIEIDIEKAEKLWKDIFNEYCNLTDDNKIIMFYDVHQDLIKMKVKQYCILKLLDVFIFIDDPKMVIEYANIFKDLGYPMDLTKGILHETDRLRKRMAFFQNAINLKQNEFDLLKGEDGTGESIPFLQQVVMVENASRRDNIDIKRTSTAKWIYILKSITNGRRK